MTNDHAKPPKKLIWQNLLLIAGYMCLILIINNFNTNAATWSKALVAALGFALIAYSLFLVGGNFRYLVKRFGFGDR